MIPISPQDRMLLEQAALIAPGLTVDALDEAALRALVREHGTDLATATLFNRVCASPRHARLAATMAATPDPALPDRLVVGVVPGAFHDRHPHTGADGERILAIARGRGLDARRIPVHPFASPESNGRIIAEWLAHRAREGHSVVLVTLSKGTLDTLAAVQDVDPRPITTLAGWLSLSGLWNGTALVDWLDRHPIQKLLARGTMAISRRPFATVESLRRRGSIAIPSPVPRIISVVGVPLRGHLRHRWAPKAYDRLSIFGPNDGGGIVLSDLRLFPGEVYPVWGADHYLNPEWDIAPLISRLLLEATRPTVASASSASPAPATRSIA